jgi:F-type H+-transporting ATPase subunit delta
MKAGSGGAARRYARALFELALAQNAGEEVRRGLREVVRVLAGSSELRTVLEHPAVAPEKKRAVVAGVWKGEHELVRRLAVLLAQRERLDLAGELERVYSQLWNAHRGAVEAEALTVQPLSEGQVRSLSDSLGRLTGREVELVSTVAPEILGGVVVRLEGKVYDGSVRGKLRALRERLVGGSQGA